MLHLDIKLSAETDWLKIFDPRDWTVFVTVPAVITTMPKTNELVSLSLAVAEWQVILRGSVVSARNEPRGVLVALGPAERDKINYLNGYVRGGLLNHRGKRRLPIRLDVNYGAIEGPTKTHTRDINDEGLFLISDRPLPETSQIHMLVTIPGKTAPLSVTGKVTHTVAPAVGETPGMGVAFIVNEAQHNEIIAIMRELEEQLRSGKLPAFAIQ